jgi:3-oxoacyl-[acyl-carrier protein] reductase
MTGNSPTLFAGRAALVTGASRGIGAATARLLAAHGAAVAVNYHHSADDAAKVVNDIETAGGHAIAIQADVTDATAVNDLVARAAAEIGPIDVLILNAAGIGRPAMAPFLEMTDTALEQNLLSQLRAVVLPARAVATTMAARGTGSIVVVSSGLARDPHAGFSDLAMAKAAIEGAARAMAHELGPQGIRVNIVAAGPTLTHATDWADDNARQRWAAETPLGRNAHASDVASAVVLMASPLAGFCTGAYLPANGGVIMP